MTKLTIIYTDGYKEHCNIVDPTDSPNALTGRHKSGNKMMDSMSGHKQMIPQDSEHRIILAL